MDKWNDAITRATMKALVKEAILNYGVQKLANELKPRCTRTAVYLWMDKGSVPPMRALQVAKILGIDRHYVRPDLYPERESV
jgi:hypothetical protein